MKLLSGETEARCLLFDSQQTAVTNRKRRRINFKKMETCSAIVVESKAYKEPTATIPFSHLSFIDDDSFNGPEKLGEKVALPASHRLKLIGNQSPLNRSLKLKFIPHSHSILSEGKESAFDFLFPSCSKNMYSNPFDVISVIISLH